MKIILFLMITLFLLFSFVHAENYLLNGGQESVIKYRLAQKIVPTSETVTVDLTYVVPQSFQSQTYKQTISDFVINFTKEPQNSEKWMDKRGNQIMRYSWSNPSESFQVEIKFKARNEVSLAKINLSAPFPVKNTPQEISTYTAPSTQVPSGNASIIARAKELVQDAQTQFDAVQMILTWIIDHMRYVLKPDRYDALYAFESGRGNCQNYSHLAAALLRAVDIPVRIVNGITLKEPYDINVGGRVMTMNMAQGRHSWIEIYFQGSGWLPFDPQQTELFVSNRFIRVETGRDNEETVQDGLVKWTRQKGSKKVLAFEEFIDAEFLSDRTTISGSKQNFGPRKLLLVPEVVAAFARIEQPLAVKPKVYDQQTMYTLKFDRKVLSGNLDFPEGINFAFIRESVDEKPETQLLQKNFLVETAEYVTSRTHYCQVFVLEQPLRLDKIGLALQNFGGLGRIWVELRENKNGQPGDVAARSLPLDLKSFTRKPGYFWVDFDFSAQGLILTPDRYWISLAYDGAPVLNWFYSYGKPVGPIDGTRYRTPADRDWSKSLGFEFNYRIKGWAPQE